MGKWFKTKGVAWGEITISLAIGGLLTYLEPTIGVPLLIVFLLFGVWLLWNAYKKNHEELEKGQSPISNKNIKKLDIQSYRKLYKVLFEMQIRQEELAEIASKQPWQNYIKFYSHLEHFNRIKNSDGEHEATLLENVLSLSDNPILEELKQKDEKWIELYQSYKALVPSIKDKKIIEEADLLISLANEGDRNWLNSNLFNASSESIHTPVIHIIKNKYHDFEKNTLSRILERINDLEKKASK